MSSIIRADKWQNALGDAYNTVLQVVSTTKTDTYSAVNNGTWGDVTGLSVTITPKFNTSKILVIANVMGGGQSGVTLGYLQLVRDSTAICIGDASGTKIRASAYPLSPPSNEGIVPVNITFLDSPATTSATTYKIQIRGQSNAVSVNRTFSDNADSQARVASTITVMEIAQ